jgi:hypothetical protein
MLQKGPPTMRRRRRRQLVGIRLFVAFVHCLLLLLVLLLVGCGQQQQQGGILAVGGLQEHQQLAVAGKFEKKRYIYFVIGLNFILFIFIV